MSRGVNVLNLNLSYEQSGAIEWGDFSRSSLSRTIALQRSQAFFSSVNSEPLSVTMSYVGFEDSICDGGQFIGVENNDIIQIRTKDLTGCKFGGYTYLNKTAGQPFDQSNFKEWLDKPVAPYRPQRRPWYIAAKSSKKPGWTPPYVFATGTVPIVGISAYNPIYKNGTLMGVLAVDMDVREFSNFLNAIKIGKTGVVYITTLDGILVASNQGNVTGSDRITGAIYSLNAVDSTNAIVSRTAVQLLREYGTWTAVPVFQNLRDPDLIVAVQYFKDSYGLDWRIVLAVETDEYLYFTNDNIRITIICGVFALAVILCVCGYLLFLSAVLEKKILRSRLESYFWERHERAAKLRRKRQRDEILATNPHKHFKGDLAIDQNDDETAWIELAVEEDKAPIDYVDVSVVLEGQRHSGAGRRTTLLVCTILISVIIVNMALWLISVATTRQQAVTTVNSLLDAISEHRAEEVIEYVSRGWIPGVSFNDMYVANGGTLLDTFSKFAYHKNNPTPTSIPSDIRLLQSILCSISLTYRADYVYIGGPGGIMLGCEYFNGMQIHASDQSTLGVYSRFDATSDFQRIVSTKKVISSTYDPTVRPWYLKATTTTNPGWTALYTFATDSIDKQDIQLGITYFIPLYRYVNGVRVVTAGNSGPLGVLGVDITLGRMKSLLNANNFISSTTQYVIDNTGSLITTMDGQIAQRVDDRLVQTKAVQSSDPIIVFTSIFIESHFGGFENVENSVYSRQTPVIATARATGQRKDVSYVVVTSCPQSSLFLEADLNSRRTFWLLFSEFTLLATISAIIIARVELDHKGMTRAPKLHFLNTENRLRNLDDITAIYNRLFRQRAFYFDDEMQRVEKTSEVSWSELDPARHSAWLEYLKLAEQEIDVENIWILRRAYGKNSVPLRLYMIETHWLYRLFCCVMIIGQCASAIFEPPNWAISYPVSETNWIVMSFEGVFILAIIMDTILQTYLALKLKSFKWKHFMIQVFFCVCFSADWLGHVITGTVRWARLLRPLNLIYRVASFRSAAILISKALIAAKWAILILFYVIIVSDLTSIALLGRIPEFSVDGDFYSTTFNNFFSAFVNMYILLVPASNYPSCVDPSVRYSRINMIFFVIIEIIGTFFMMSTIIAQFSNEYDLYVQQSKERFRKRCWMALAATFIIFDSQNKGCLSRREFTVFIVTYLRTKYPELDRQISEEIKLLNEQIIHDQPKNKSVDDVLTVQGVPKKLKDVLFGCFHVVDQSGDGTVSIDEFETGIHLALLSYTISSKSTRLAELSRSMSYFIVFRFFMPMVLLVYILLLAGYNSIFVGQENYLDVMVSVCLLLMLLEMVLRVFYLYPGFLAFWNEEDSDVQFVNRYDLVLIFGSVILGVICWIYAAADKTLKPFSGKDAVNRTYMCLAALRMFTVNRHTLRIIAVLIEVIPVCSQIGVVTLVLFYIYASIGGVFFSGFKISSYTGDFNTFIGSWIMMYQLFVGESWNSVMSILIANTSTAALWFSMTWSFFVSQLISALLVGVVIGQFSAFLKDPTKRLIAPRIRNVLNVSEIEKLRVMSEQVFDWIRVRHNNEAVSRAQRVINNLQFGFKSFYNLNKIGLTDFGISEKERQSVLNPELSSNMSVSELLKTRREADDIYSRSDSLCSLIEKELMFRKQNGIIPDLDLSGDGSVCGTSKPEPSVDNAKNVTEMYRPEDVFSNNNVIFRSPNLYRQQELLRLKQQKEYLDGLLNFIDDKDALIEQITDVDRRISLAKLMIEQMDLEDGYKEEAVQEESSDEEIFHEDGSVETRSERSYSPLSSFHLNSRSSDGRMVPNQQLSNRSRQQLRNSWF